LKVNELVATWLPAAPLMVVESVAAAEAGPLSEKVATLGLLEFRGLAGDVQERAIRRCRVGRPDADRMMVFVLT
jgi:hypothetical protein